MSGVVASVAGQPFGPLAGLPQATLQAMLNDAIQARHKLMIQQLPTVVLYSAGEGSRSATFNRTSLPNLLDYIGELQAALGIGHGRRRGFVVR